MDLPDLEMSAEGPDRKGSTHSSSPVATDSSKLETYKGCGGEACKLASHTVPSTFRHDFESGSGI